MTWTIKYRKPDGFLTYGRTSNPKIATFCIENRMSTAAGALFSGAEVIADILAARKEADVNFDGGWEGDCTRGLKAVLKEQS